MSREELHPAGVSVECLWSGGLQVQEKWSLAEQTDAK